MHIYQSKLMPNPKARLKISSVCLVYQTTEFFMSLKETNFSDDHEIYVHFQPIDSFAL